MGQNAEVMPRPLNLSIVIHSLEALRPEATLCSPHRFQQKPSKGGLERKRLGSLKKYIPEFPGIEIYQGGAIDSNTGDIPLDNKGDIASYRVIAKLVHKLCLGRDNPK